MAVGKNITRKGRSLPYDIKAVGKNIKWGGGEWDGNFGKKIKIKKNGGGEENQVVGNFIQPCFHVKTNITGCCAGP